MQVQVLFPALKLQQKLELFFITLLISYIPVRGRKLNKANVVRDIIGAKAILLIPVRGRKLFYIIPARFILCRMLILFIPVRGRKPEVYRYPAFNMQILLIPARGR